MAAERSNRRGFLRGESAVRELADRAFRFDEAPRPAPRRALTVSVRRRAMACEFEVQLAAARNDNSMEHVFESLNLVEAIEAQISIYREDSEVSRINQAAAHAPVPVEPRLFCLLERVSELCAATEGALDITSGPLSEAWGFSRRLGNVPSDEAIELARSRVGMNHVRLDAARETVSFGCAGVSINFNSIGKGYALDRMAELLDEHAVGDYLLQGGRSSVLARGDQPGSAEPGWRVGVRHPLRQQEPLAELVLREQALSTSGAGTQFFVRRGKRYGHILDPRTGRPAEGLYSATVLAPTAIEAEALSTAFYVMGPDRASQCCAQRPEISALLVAPGPREGDVRLIALGPEGDSWLRLAASTTDITQS
ncbi:MAG: FAD:protein FMN transferase [Pirellulales bacterium]|nr:FAD:protein FMN transferase [Pirellulales bacterium]